MYALLRPSPVIRLTPSWRSLFERVCYFRNRQSVVTVNVGHGSLKGSRSFSASIKPSAMKESRSASTAASLKPDIPSELRSNPSLTSSPIISSDLPLVRSDEKRVLVGWNPLKWTKFHNFWLRDHCRCPECFHQITNQRLVDTFEIPPDVRPLAVEATPDGLKITWHLSIPHISIYPWNWLKWNSYDPPQPNIDESLPFRTPEKVLWGAKIAQDPPTVEHDYIMSDDRGLWKLLTKIDTFGFCFVPGLKATPEATEELILKIGNIRQTQYGAFWDFTADLAKGDTAYTTLALGAHTDTTYFTDPCGLQIFHLLSHTGGQGGQSLLIDGFYVASLLKELHPEAYNMLSTVCVPTHAAGEPGALYRPSPPSGYPILGLDPRSGELTKVRYNNDDRSVMRAIDPEKLEQWYEALRLWNKALKSQDSEFWVQLTPGTAVVIDNQRVLHGRSAFDGKRRMCGAYIGMDDYRSKLTVLAEKFAGGTAGDLPAGETAGSLTRSKWSHLF